MRGAFKQKKLYDLVASYLPLYEILSLQTMGTQHTHLYYNTYIYSITSVVAGSLIGRETDKFN